MVHDENVRKAYEIIGARFGKEPEELGNLH